MRILAIHLGIQQITICKDPRLGASWYCHGSFLYECAMLIRNPADLNSPNRSTPLVHITYFRLVDRAPTTIRRFLSLCQKYLSKHEGQTYFSLGLRATEMVRDVNVLTFDVAMNMIFADIDAYTKYQHNNRHVEFITQSAGMSSARSVFDSYLADKIEFQPARAKKRRKKVIGSNKKPNPKKKRRTSAKK
jgi:hypothetical protein